MRVSRKNQKVKQKNYFFPKNGIRAVAQPNKKPRLSAGLSFCAVGACAWTASPLVHAAQSARHWSLFLLLRQLRHESFRRQHERSDTARVLQRGASDFGGVNDAGLHQVLELTGLGVESEVVVLGIADLAHHNRALL